MKQQTYIAQPHCPIPQDTQQARIHVVRRLTPAECELLMSLPRGWTEYGHDGKPMSDSARYQMCGNSIVVNVLAYIMQNIAARLGKGESHV
ncbi:MAG: DNA cytosine methyltransferase [Gracilibacteraceae bacterium]|nr:DNA cytosine methyltransferase [Gracilibacteraceae bacterium]